jgi:hypothetical protein
MVQNERNGLTKVRETLLTRFALTIGPGNFRTVCDVPRAILFDDRCELIAHISFYRRYHAGGGKLPSGKSIYSVTPFSRKWQASLPPVQNAALMAKLP